MIPWAVPNIQAEDKAYVSQVINSGWYTMGPVVADFEKKMKSLSKRKHCIAVNNGTAALEVLLRAMQIGPGDEVIVPAFSYIATANAVRLVGAKPVFVDVDESTCINPSEIEKRVTKKTKAILSVDLAGMPCNYSTLEKKAKKHNIPLIVDGAQSLGSTYKGKPCLSYGLASTTSFHSAKVITTIEGGMIFTDNDSLASKIKKIRNHGEGNKKYVHDVLGGNYRMTDISAAFAIKQVARFKTTLSKRKKSVQHYQKSLAGTIGFPKKQPLGESGNFIMLILTDKREKLCKYLTNNEIEIRKIYEKTIPQPEAYNETESFPMAEWFCQHSISLPLYEGLFPEEINYICEKIKECVKS